MKDTVARVLAASILCATASAQVTQRVSVSTSGAQATNHTNLPVVSADGRYVAFHGNASNLVSGDTNVSIDVFVRDRQLGTTERVSVATGGAQGNADSSIPAISGDARFVAFPSDATNLVLGDTNAAKDVFVRDRQLGTTERVSVATGGAQANAASNYPAISDDGRYVVFYSDATDLVLGDTNGVKDIFVHDRQLGTTERVSVATGGAQADGASNYPRISADGLFVAWFSSATNLVAGDTNTADDVFVRDLLLGSTERVSVSHLGAQGDSGSSFPSISSDGRFVAFRSAAHNLVAGPDINGSEDVFVRDRQLSTTERASEATGGTQANALSYNPSISGDGRYVAFHSFATNLVAGDTNGIDDVFVRDRTGATTARASIGLAGAQGNSFSTYPAISADGRFVAFRSVATNLAAADTNAKDDVFVHDRVGSPDFTSLCDAGLGGVIACPCGNPSGGAGRGCDNSSATGGAMLSASGGTYLSSDSLVLTTSGERPTSLSIVAQWIGYNATGVAFGMGVRCTSSTFKRLFSRNAVAGSITVPNFAGGDLSVSAQSAAKGDTILAGQSRWYVVYYRDPNVLGGCPATSNFNATQTGQVSWSP